MSPGRPSSSPPFESEPFESASEPSGAARGEEDRVPLRLTVARGALGLELYEPIELGPFSVESLSLTLPNLKFPVDLSGGVQRFRHRRGDLEHLGLSLAFDKLSKLALPRVKDVVPGARRVVVWGRSSGIGVGIAGTSAALAFDLLWAPSAGDARIVVSRARGVGLGAPALGHALRALDATLEGIAERRGRLVIFSDSGSELGKAILPAVGARAPSARRVRFSDITVQSDRVVVELDAEVVPPALGAEATREVELALLVETGDQLLASGDVESARAEYVAALEQAPRHPELVRMVAEIDAAVGGRGEAALGMLVESLPAHRAGLVGAELLASVGDLGGAREASREAVRDEPFAPLAALAYCRLAALEKSAPERRAALDMAVARAPGLAEPRWARLVARLEVGDIAGAVADAEHYEAQHTGSAARHDACYRAGRALLEHGYVTDAGRLFERALRYAPDDAAATAGLARALMEAGKRGRAVALLERAVALSEGRGRPDADALLDLARLLADDLKDLPQAIARVRGVSASSERMVEARRLEALWRSRIGDLAGASLAYARMREGVELGARTDSHAAEWLVEAAHFERDARREITAAELHLGVALRLSPHDPMIAAKYREVAGELAEKLRRDREAARGDKR